MSEGGRPSVQSREARPSAVSVNSREVRPSVLRSGVSTVLVVGQGQHGQSVVSSIAPHMSATATLLPGTANTHDCRVQPWPATAALIIAEVVGTGVLALGGAFSKLGWISGLLVLLIGYFVNVFTSLLLGKVHVAFPDAVTLGDALTRLLGRCAGYFGYGVLYAYLFFTCANYIVVLSVSVQSVVYSTPLCRTVATAIGCLLLLPGNQLRTLADITMLGAASFLMVLATIVVCVWTLAQADGSEGGGSCTGEPIEPDFLDYNAAACAFIFAYAGQSIMLEMQAEMKAPEDFPKAAVGSFTVMFFVYALVAIMAYHACGAQTPGDLLHVLPANWTQALVGVMMVLHLIVSYTIVQQVLTRAVCLSFVPRALEVGFAARIRWFAVSTGIMGLSYVVANSIPLFADIVSITGAVLSTQCALTFPAMLYLAMYYKHPEALQMKEGLRNLGAVLSFGTLALGLYFTVVGTASSVAVMARHAEDGVNPPFGCG